MSDKKHIDRIFQEKLKDFEETPNPTVWKNIQSKIDTPKEKTKKVFPIWMRIASIAALLFLMLTVGNLINSNQNNDSKTDIVDTENTENTSLANENKNSSIKTSVSENKNNAIVEGNSNSSTSETSIQALKNASKENTPNPSITSTNLVEERKNNKIKSTNQLSNNALKNTTNFSTTKGYKNNRITNNTAPFVSAKNQNASLSNAEQVATNNSQKNNVIVTSSNPENRTTTNKNSNFSTKSVKGAVDSQITELDKTKVESVLNNNTKNTIAEYSQNIESESKENIEEIAIDTETKKEETSIEEEIAKTEDLIEEEENVNRWQVYANIAPVYYNTLGKGSHIDEQFVGNSKTGEVNTSYGVNVSYAFNKKLKLRSGVNSLNLSYDTDNVILYQNVSGSSAPTLKNIDFNNSEQAVSAISATNLGVQQALGILPNENAAISQRLGYYEIPLELEYTISNNKFGVNVIAGMSTFVLNDNKIFTEYEGRKTEIGEANNINDFSFSGNLGLGLDYKFSDKVKFNVQPTFKYQMNAFENTSGDFRPYIVGIYTGLSYKF